MSLQINSIISSISRKINVLAVDDDPAILEMIKDLLSSPFVNLITANSAFKAEKLINDKKYHWHCWTLDITMEEEKSGITVLKNNPGFAFVIMLSGMQSMSIASEAIAAGAMRVFDKIPSEIEPLKESLCKIATLGFLTGGAVSKNLDTYTLFFDNFFQTPEEWAQKACITTRQLERICRIHSDLTPRFQIPLYYSLYHLLMLGEDITCSIDLENSIPKKVLPMIDFVEKHFDSVYSKWLLNRH